MGEETFEVYTFINRIGDDNLPHHLIQVDVEDSTKKHIVRIFIPVAELKQFIRDNENWGD